MKTRHWIKGGLILGLALVVGVGLWKTGTWSITNHAPIIVDRKPVGVMATSCHLVVVVSDLPDPKLHASQTLDAAEQALRDVEAHMSSWITASEVSRFNRAKANVLVPLSPATLEVLRAARHAAKATNGAFDVTCRPVIELWRRAGKTGQLPTPPEITAARAASSWELIELTETGAIKKVATARVDLGGIAKGYANDQAIKAMHRLGVTGGLVDVGGDVVCFGSATRNAGWAVEIKDPRKKGTLGTLRIRDAAVCTSGDYARFAMIGGKRYSHIIDPRTGQPATTTIAVTVIAPSAMTADIWATALSVLGPQGLSLLPQDVEAMLLLQEESNKTKKGFHAVYSKGFQKYLDKPIE